MTITYSNSNPTQKTFIDNQIKRYIAACQTSLVDMLLKKEILSYDEILNLYNDCDDKTGSEPQEIYEWYLLTDNFIRKELLKLGEPILDTAYGCWWGRTCTGQNIVLDPTFWIIYQDIINYN